ncbi:hypothetical protein ZYGR_0A00820 [Zygosaccharomyces rouxii]|uniref:protein-tyrosine-phosphatase n=2 Tax=Zygosaccharomyces rouxii TaxID=4956 RepID=C5DPA7_ZYGRC|nr:uncharacterized protein ZYRO0A01760g [Zygosaccharomyces rouxii]KAH9198962.1 dual specificity phosphatase [Zygosaccharomyces rouxii]GAV46490.1 hypothetical protein ZYGR_0A00820 [Zygosaccharomyces rouxii]CAR25518.1 ZYRO0A01760p [Zygosaccharomyces rouxii]
MSAQDPARSPRSFQAKNTKNLSLNISKPSTATAARTTTGLQDTPIPRPVGLGDTKFRRPTPLMSRRSDAAIYTQRRNANSNGNNNSNNGNGPRLHRVHSLSLSVKTTELEPPASSKQMWVLPRKKSFDEDVEKSGVGPSSAENAGNAYPDGPLCVVSPNVYLYSEPTLEQALKFDLVINVAAEIADLGPLIHRGSGVEYVRVPWTHNTRIIDELPILTETIHLAQQRGLRVLIHCQCGVSRSASLIVAYIMRYEKLPLNDAYEKLKSVALDISPNMGLIFQLMEWGETLDSESRLISSFSQETTPRTPGEYFKTNLSSASTCSSTTVVSERE